VGLGGLRGEEYYLKILKGGKKKIFVEEQESRQGRGQTTKNLGVTRGLKIYLIKDSPPERERRKK